MKRKILLIVGGSDLAGAELDGQMDSTYNRANSFAARLTRPGRVFEGYEVINAATSGSANSTIARTALMWFRDEYDPDTMDVFVIVGWTESARMEAPWDIPLFSKDDMWPAADFCAEENFLYLHINVGWEHSQPEQAAKANDYINFMVDNQHFFEQLSLNLVMQLQWFLEKQHVPYYMLNTLHMFSKDNKHLEPYYCLLNEHRYMYFDNNAESFYTKYKDLGYTNPKAQYWHHGEEPHELYSQIIEHNIHEFDLLEKP